MKKNVALTLAAFVATLAVCFIYKNQTAPKALTTANAVAKSTVAPIEGIPNTIGSQQVAPQSATTTEKGPLSINAQKAAKTRFAEAETKTTVANESADADRDPLLNGRHMTKQARINEAIALEIERTKDPQLGYVPKERLLRATEETRRLQADFYNQKEFLRGAISNARWMERGPGNVGGRTRAILVDRNDPTGKTVFVGSSLGGLFKTTDITNAAKPWERVNDWLENLTISSIAQDPRNPKIMYIGTGDTDTEGRDGLGLCMFKSVDGGKTWAILPSTLGVAAFRGVAAMVITPDNSTIFAATANGLQRSKDGGTTWERVLGSGGRVCNVQLGSDKRLYASTNSTVYKSTQNGDAGSWTVMKDFGWSRTEIAVAPTDPNVIYAIGEVSNKATNVQRSGDGGVTWIQKNTITWSDGCSSNNSPEEFSRGQAWYDLCITVDPTNANALWVGGIDMHRSLDGGASWLQASYWANCPNKKYAHADQHILYFDPTDPSVLYSGNDGGIFRVNNAAGNFTIQERTLGFVSTLFYGCAMRPDSAADYFLAGAQDNGNMIMRGKGVALVNGRGFGGDGFLTFINQNNGDVQIGSSYGGVWFLSINGGASFGGAPSSNGNFFTPADYDDKNNIFYAQTNSAFNITTSGDLFRWNVTTQATDVLDLAGVNLTNISNIFSDENVNGRVYIGTRNGLLYRSNGTNTGTSINDVQRLFAFPGYISSIDVERGNANHLLVTLSSYGAQSVWESRDGGATFKTCDFNNNLPDMPVRWGIFNPIDGKSAFIATDLGVWSTDLLNDSTTRWQPPVPGRGTPLVRTDRIEWRKSDKMLLAGTYGRGIWTSSVLGKAQAVAEYPAVTYLDVPVNFKGESSVSADRFKWLFSDNGAIDTVENTQHIFRSVGKFDVSLTINDDNALKTTGKMQILPSLPSPYKSGTSVYAGGFEDATADVHFGAWNTGGSKWERGVSAVPGKSGTHTGASAFVLEKTANAYKKNTTAYLQTPNFDMSKAGIYQFSFWANYDIQGGFDGLKVEYTLDKGISWKQLGSNADENWFNYQNTSLPDGAAFGVGESYITGQAEDWARFKLNVSPFAGNANVAFRFVFKSDGDNVTGSGVAIDDVVLSRYDGKLETVLITQSGAYDRAGTSINVNFQTQPEYFARTFTLQQSINGRTWEDVATAKAKGVSSEELQDYPIEVKGTPLDFYYFRVKSVNNDAKSAYSFDFTSTPFVVRRNKDLPLAINRVFPSPFTNVVGVTFTDIVTTELVMSLYDDLGRLVATQTTTPNAVYQDLKVPNLAKGIYFLTVKIGTGKAETVKVFGAGGN